MILFYKRHSSYNLIYNQMKWHINKKCSLIIRKNELQILSYSINELLLWNILLSNKIKYLFIYFFIVANKIKLSILYKNLNKISLYLRNYILSYHKYTHPYKNHPIKNKINNTNPTITPAITIGFFCA